MSKGFLRRDNHFLDQCFVLQKSQTATALRNTQQGWQINFHGEGQFEDPIKVSFRSKDVKQANLEINRQSVRLLILTGESEKMLKIVRDPDLYILICAVKERFKKRVTAKTKDSFYRFGLFDEILLGSIRKFSFAGMAEEERSLLGVIDLLLNGNIFVFLGKKEDIRFQVDLLWRARNREGI